MRLQTTYFIAPTEEQREHIRKSVNSTAESVKRDVQHLIEWLEKQPHLPNYKDENVLAHCLIQCENSLEKTKRRFEKYCNAKSSFPEVFYDRNPYGKCFEEQKNLAMYVPLRKLTPDGCRVIMLYLSDECKNRSDFPPIEYFFKMNNMVIELGAKLDFARGVILVHDGANFNMSIVATLSSHLQKMLFLTEKAMPISYKKMYFFNMGQAMDIIITISKSLIKKKLAERIEILKNPSDLCEVLPKEIVPKEYGGDELPLKELKDMWFEDMKANYNYLKAVENVASDLSKLPKDFVSTELSGMAGSFRQISLD